MTRRKKVEGTVRDHLVALRLTELEYETVCDLAKEAGMSVSGYLRRQAIFGKVEIHNHIVAEFPKLDKLLRQFAGIGNNLNQLTRYYHMGGIVSQSMTEELQMCISEIMEMRKEVSELAGEYRGYNKTQKRERISQIIVGSPRPLCCYDSLINSLLLFDKSGRLFRKAKNV